MNRITFLLSSILILFMTLGVSLLIVGTDAGMVLLVSVLVLGMLVYGWILGERLQDAGFGPVTIIISAVLYIIVTPFAAVLTLAALIVPTDGIEGVLSK